jgi:hypothetical protein
VRLQGVPPVRASADAFDDGAADQEPARFADLFEGGVVEQDAAAGGTGDLDGDGLVVVRVGDLQAGLRCLIDRLLLSAVATRETISPRQVVRTDVGASPATESPPIVSLRVDGSVLSVPSATLARVNGDVTSGR